MSDDISKAYCDSCCREVDYGTATKYETEMVDGVCVTYPVIIPLCAPTIIAAMLMVFMRAFADFGTPLFIGEGGEPFSVEGLYALLQGRKETLPEGSYTTYLFQKGLDKILKKVGEESTEVIIAGKAEDKRETVYEIADLMYHVMVLMVEMGISVEDVYKELASRHIIDHKVKQEKMTP